MNELDQVEPTCASVGGVRNVPSAIKLELTVTNPEVIVELSRHDGPRRDEYALAALRLGVLALHQASGLIDSTTIRSEGERVVQSLETVLTEHFSRNMTSMAETLKRYFDPAAGDLPQRLERLLKKDGELEALLANHLGNDSSTIARTLAQHIGVESPIFKILSPQQSDGILAAMTQVIRGALDQQRDQILGQFSMDQKDSALSRLSTELCGANGKLRDNFAKDLLKISGEFSLDNQDGALFRLVSRVEAAQSMIRSQFSLDEESSALSRLSRLLQSTNDAIAGSLTLDDENSPLYRLRRELMHVMETFSKSNSDFQSDVRASLAGLAARRKEADRSTRHGGEFEEAVGQLLQEESQRVGDVFEATGNSTGVVPYCKKGDHVLTLGCESAAPNARIVIEAKENASCTLKDALTEIAEARNNREAQIGVFVFSKRTAPDGIEPLARHGNDLIVVWDRDDPTTDVFLKGSVSIARALVFRARASAEKTIADFGAIDRSLNKIARNAELLEEIKAHATTVRNSGDNIFEKIKRIKKDLDDEIEDLRGQLDCLNPVRIAPAA